MVLVITSFFVVSDGYSNGSLMHIVIMIHMKLTTISITKSTRDAVAAIGSKDQSFEKIIQLLLEKWNENNE